MPELREQLLKLNTEKDMTNIKEYIENHPKPDTDHFRDDADHEIFNYLLKTKRSSKMLSKKALARLNKEFFHIHYKDLHTHMFFRCNAESARKISFSIKLIYYVSTPKGLLYFQIKDKDGILIVKCYFSHFFDRLSERIEEKNRIDWLKQMLYKREPSSLILDFNSFEAKTINSEGMILGKYMLYENPEDVKNIMLIITNQTFISKDMFTTQQRDMYEKVSNKQLKSTENLMVIYPSSPRVYLKE